MKNSFVTLLILIGILNRQFVHNCRPSSQEYFPGGENGVGKAFAYLKGSMNGSTIVGKIYFEQKGLNGAIHITGNITGLPLMAVKMKHGLHAHSHTIMEDLNDVSRCGSSGGHFNPTNSDHGDITAKIRHVGDFGNVVSDTNGLINVDIVDNLAKLYGPFGIIGRTIVLHKLEDDLGLVDNLGSKTTGNAGSRIACGIIGIILNDN